MSNLWQTTPDYPIAHPNPHHGEKPPGTRLAWFFFAMILLAIVAGITWSSRHPLISAGDCFWSEAFVPGNSLTNNSRVVQGWGEPNAVGDWQVACDEPASDGQIWTVFAVIPPPAQPDPAEIDAWAQSACEDTGYTRDTSSFVALTTQNAVRDPEVRRGIIRGGRFRVLCLQPRGERVGSDYPSW